VESRAYDSGETKVTPAVKFDIGKVKEIYPRRGVLFVLTSDDYLYCYGSFTFHRSLFFAVPGYHIRESSDSDHEFSLVDIGKVKKMHAGEDILIETFSGDFWVLPYMRNLDRKELEVWVDSVGYHVEKDYPLKRVNMPVDSDEIKEFNGGLVLTQSGLVYKSEVLLNRTTISFTRGRLPLPLEWYVETTVPPVKKLIYDRNYIYLDHAEISSSYFVVTITNTEIDQIFAKGPIIFSVK
jgi:hypothetical protein